MWVIQKQGEDLPAVIQSSQLSSESWFLLLLYSIFKILLFIKGIPPIVSVWKLEMADTWYSD